MEEEMSKRFVQPNSFFAELSFRIFAEAMIGWEQDRAPKLDDIVAVIESACEKWFANLPTGGEVRTVDLTVQPNSDREPEKPEKGS